LTRLTTDVLVVGSGAGGATTAAVLAEAGRRVTLIEEGPRVDPDAHEPFSLAEMAAKYRHHGSSAALGAPPIAYAEGRCVGGSTEINSGLWHRLPGELAEEWRRLHAIDEFTPTQLDEWASRVEERLSIAPLPAAPPLSSALIERGAAKLGWRAVEVPRVVRYEADGRAVRQTMLRTLVPRAERAGVEVVAGCRARRLRRAGDRITGAECEQRRPDGTVEHVNIAANDYFVCGGAVQTPALLQRSGVRGPIGRGLKMHPTIKVAARFPHPVDHDDVPMHRVSEFAPDLAIGGSASRRGHIGLALADAGAAPGVIEGEWGNVFVYYAAIRSDGSGRVVTLPGLAAPVVTYRLTDADVSRLARGAVLLGELLLAAGATELYPSVAGAPVVRRVDDLAHWWAAVDRTRTNLMTVHLTSTAAMGGDGTGSGTDSFGRVWGYRNLRVNDASLLPAAPGVNPQAAIMTIALRNAEQFLAAA
jgi:choline dehydrogenase-like flavoprotein